MKMQPDGGTFSLSEPLCSFGGASPSALFFFPQTIHVGGLENKTETWEDPCEHTGSFIPYAAAELDIQSIEN